MRLRAEGLAAFRGERLVLAQVSLAVPAGGALLLTGPNGAGKSTLLRLLAGLVRAEAGRLLWDGADVLADPAAHARAVAYLGHQDAIKPGLSAAENLLFAAAAGHAAASQAIEGEGGAGVPDTVPARGAAPARQATLAAALAALDLEALAGLPAAMLSAGQRRRLALARVMLARAPLWLLDEPTLGLDVGSLTRFGVVLAAHRAAGGVVVAATHLPLPLPGATELALTRRPGS